MSFGSVSQTLLDNWLRSPASEPDQLFPGVLDHLTSRMRLAVIDINSLDQQDWILRPVRHSRISSRILNLNTLFKGGRLGDIKDQDYMARSVFPQYRKVIDMRQPAIDMVETKLLGISVTYDRIILPDRVSAATKWLVTCTYGRFMAGSAPQNFQLDSTDETILMHVMAGESSKEIAPQIGLSARTVEHRLERLRKQVGARNLPHLITMLIVSGFNRSVHFASDDRVFEDVNHPEIPPGAPRPGSDNVNVEN